MGINMNIEKKINKIMNMDISRKKFIATFGALLIAIPLMSKNILAKVWFRDEDNNMYSLSQETPSHIFIKATGESEGDLHLSDATNWNVNKSIIKVVRVNTASTDWDLYILQNDNGFATDDANIPKMQLVEAGNGNANILVNLPYEDEDASGEVHFYYVDNNGAETADIYVLGERRS